MAKSKRRKQLLIEKAQRTVLRHVLRDWGILLGVTWSLAMIWQIVTVGPFQNLTAAAAATWGRYAPVFILMFCVIPLLIRRTLRLSNRAAGPLMRIGREMKAYMRGEDVSPIQLREGDFGHELASDFNQLVANSQEQKTTKRANTETDQLSVFPVAAGGDRA